MNIRHIFITIAAIVLASAALADSSSVTSKKYVDDFMTGYQNKIPGSGTNKLMIYDSNESDGINQKAIVSSLGDSTSATDVPNVGAVKAGMDGKQDTINGTAGYVMTGTGNAGVVDEKPIYGATTRYTDALVTAEAVNTGVINAVNNSLRRVNANGEPDNNGTLWEIADVVVALSFLPASYTQLEYIKSTGSQYIDNIINPTKDYSFEITYKHNVGSGYQTLFAVYDGLNTTNTYSYGFMAGSAVNGNYVYSGNSKTFTLAYDTSTIYTLRYDGINKKVYRNNTEIVDFSSSRGFTGTTGVAPRLLQMIKGENATNNFNYPFIGLVYGFKVWNENSELVRNLIPASTVENNATVVGMYDTVSGTFFTNSATSGPDFTAGPPVSN